MRYFIVRFEALGISKASSSHHALVKKIVLLERTSDSALFMVFGLTRLRFGCRLDYFLNRSRLGNGSGFRLWCGCWGGSRFLDRGLFDWNWLYNYRFGSGLDLERRNERLFDNLGSRLLCRLSRFDGLFRFCLRLGLYDRLGLRLHNYSWSLFIDKRYADHVKSSLDPSDKLTRRNDKILVLIHLGEWAIHLFQADHAVVLNIK